MNDMYNFIAVTETLQSFYKYLLNLACKLQKLHKFVKSELKFDKENDYSSKFQKTHQLFIIHLQLLKN